MKLSSIVAFSILSSISLSLPINRQGNLLQKRIFGAIDDILGAAFKVGDDVAKNIPVSNAPDGIFDDLAKIDGVPSGAAPDLSDIPSIKDIDSVPDFIPPDVPSIKDIDSVPDFTPPGTSAKAGSAPGSKLPTSGKAEVGTTGNTPDTPQVKTGDTPNGNSLCARGKDSICDISKKTLEGATLDQLEKWFNGKNLLTKEEKYLRRLKAKKAEEAKEAKEALAIMPEESTVLANKLDDGSDGAVAKVDKDVPDTDAKMPAQNGDVTGDASSKVDTGIASSQHSPSVAPSHSTPPNKPVDIHGKALTGSDLLKWRKDNIGPSKVLMNTELAKVKNLLDNSDAFKVVDAKQTEIDQINLVEKLESDLIFLKTDRFKDQKLINSKSFDIATQQQKVSKLVGGTYKQKLGELNALKNDRKELNNGLKELKKNPGFKKTQNIRLN